MRQEKVIWQKDAEVYASQAGSGDERAEEIQTEAPAEQTQVQEQAAAASEYILNTNTMKFHRPKLFQRESDE